MIFVRGTALRREKVNNVFLTAAVPGPKRGNRISEQFDASFWSHTRKRKLATKYGIILPFIRGLTAKADMATSSGHNRVYAGSEIDIKIMYIGNSRSAVTNF